MTPRFFRNPLFCLLFAIALTIPLCLQAQEKEEDKQTESPALQNTNENNIVRFGILAGAGGFSSSSTSNAVALVNTEGMVHVAERWHLGLGLNLKIHPSSEYRSVYSTIGVQGRFDIWRGLYLQAGFGLAWNFLQKDSYQESDIGYGAVLQAGCLFCIVKHFGIDVRAHSGIRVLEVAYFDYGIMAGPALSF